MASAENIQSMSTLWQALKVHHQLMKNSHLLQLFAEDHHRGERFSIEEKGIYLDFSKNLITDKTVELLVELAKIMDLPGKIEERFTPLDGIGRRSVFQQAVERDGETLRMTALADRIWNGAWTGYSGMRIKTVIVLNVDESDPGPPMAYGALQKFIDSDLSVIFLTGTDKTDFCTLLSELNPAETLLTVVSDTFTCRETMVYAHMARRWILKAMRDEWAVARHFIAVTRNGDEARKFGIEQENIFGSLNSGTRNRAAGRLLGFQTVVSLGTNVFTRLTAGIRAMDRHFSTAPLNRNLPVIMGLLRVWYRNFYGSRQTAILPYHRQLTGLPAHADRLFSGSDNGLEAHLIGAPGNGSPQKHDAICRQIIEGNTLCPCDFIGFCRDEGQNGESNSLLMAEMFGLTRTLAFGGHATAFQNGKCPDSLRHYVPMEGNHPSNTILAESLTPEVFGELLTLYEHAAHTQQVVGQWGVTDRQGMEVGKLEAEDLARELERGSSAPGHDSSTSCLIRHYRSISGTAGKIGFS
jgi:glucose-6-phosphate isomerase